MSENGVKVSYLTMASGPALWGSVGSVVVEPGEGRWIILRRLHPDLGPVGYLIVDLVKAEIHRGYETEKDARAEVARLAGRKP